MVKERHVEAKLLSLARFSKVVMVLGARQVGKSTLLKKVFPHIPHITFDAHQDLYNVKGDPDLFLAQFSGPVIFDEVQYVPELLSAIKRKVDQSDKPGQYFLTGSQNFSMLKNMSETMSGRVAIVYLSPMTIHEAYDAPRGHWLPLLFEAPNQLLETKPLPTEPLWKLLWKGLMPGYLLAPDDYRQSLMESYINTYIERDIHLLDNIRDLGDFRRFLALMAALSAQEINTSQLGREVGVTHTTAHRWKGLLEASFQWNSLRSYSGNTIKQISKKEKFYMADTGLASYLLRLSSPDSLGIYPSLGALFESFVVQQVIGMKNSMPLSPYLYHWRSKGGAEVDLIVERDGLFHLIEIKMKTHLRASDIRGFKSFKETYPHLRFGTSLLIYAGDRVFRLNDDVMALPFNASI